MNGNPTGDMLGRSIHSVLTGGVSVAYDSEEIIAGEMQDRKWVRQGNLRGVSIPEPKGAGEWEL